MATIFNEQRVLGIRLVADGTKMHNGLPVIGIAPAADGVLFAGNQRVIGVEVLPADKAIHNEQPVRGAVLISDGRTLYNDMLVIPSSGATPELRGGGVIGLVGAAAVATYDTVTGIGSVTRVNSTNQSFVTFDVAANRKYKFDIQGDPTNALWIRAGSAAGSIVGTVNAGSRQEITVSTGVATSLVLTASAAATETFTIHSLGLAQT